MSSDSPIRKSNKRYQSDIIVDLIKAYDFPYIALNPGASYRGLHDSMVNYGENDPPMLLCNHEKIAIQIAHGYTKAIGKPMAAAVHNVVGLLHAPLAVYYAYIDRCPVFLIGATGPMDEKLRRPFIDWIHTAFAQGSAVRDFTKWDYQPGSIHGVPDSFARAYSIMMSEPQGPIYMVYDAGLQEAELTEDIPIPPASAVKVPPRLAADAKLIDEAAEILVGADYPVLLTEYAARAPIGYEPTVALAEATGAAVFDINKRLGFPNRHPQNVSMHADAFAEADLVMALDVIDWTRGSHKPNWETREVESLCKPGCKWIDIGFADIEISKWATDYNKHHNWDMRILADTTNAIPALTEACLTRIKDDSKAAARIEDRKQAIAAKHEAQWTKWQDQVKEHWDQLPMHESRMAHEVWQVIKDEDWVLTAGTLKNWALKTWDFDTPYRHPGRDLGTATQFGISLGVALAHKGSGKLVVDLQPDGDLMFDLGALWVATKYEIPMLVVMYNNRAYYNDWAHQISVAKTRGTDPARANIGMDLYGPEPDFAHIAKGMDWFAEGPIEDPADIGPALARAIEQVKAGKPALVDIIVDRRGEMP
ncbi:MAG: thiamine pyrophosphate-binding protein [Alphaproteobacteria bacterium]|nr:thiamine pyrophosphate-binding protein [Alphaproteobacteria bacterium]